jgi:hypothetical protein
LAAQTLAIMVSLFVASWLPYALIAQFGILGLSDLVTPYSAEIPVLLAKTSAVWNPVIYALTGWSKIYKVREQQRRRYRNWSSSTSSSFRHSVKMAASVRQGAESSVTDDTHESKTTAAKFDRNGCAGLTAAIKDCLWVFEKSVMGAIIRNILPRILFLFLCNLVILQHFQFIYF